MSAWHAHIMQATYVALSCRVSSSTCCSVQDRPAQMQPHLLPWRPAAYLWTSSMLSACSRHAVKSVDSCLYLHMLLPFFGHGHECHRKDHCGMGCCSFYDCKQNTDFHIHAESAVGPLPGSTGAECSFCAGCQAGCGACDDNTAGAGHVWHEPYADTPGLRLRLSVGQSGACGH